MAVGGAHAEILGDAAAALLQHVVERGAEAVAVERMQHVEPLRRRAFQRAGFEPKRGLGLRAGVHLVVGDVPVPDHVAGAGERQRAAFDVGDDALGDAAGEGVLHHRKSDQHDDQNKPAEERRADDVVGDEAQHRHGRGNDPDDQQQPGRDQHHRAIEAVGGEIDHEAEAEDRDQKQRDARDARGDIRREQSDADQPAQRYEPDHGDVGVAHVPAVEVQIGEQEHQQRRRQDRFARRAPDALGARRHVEHLAPETEVDADIDQHRPAERGCGGKHHAAFDHEQDGEEQRQQSGNADDDALVERQRIDLVLVGVGLPQIELRHVRRAQLGDEGDHRAGIEGDAEHVGVRAVLPLRRIARRRRDVDDARLAEIGPDQAGADHAVMRHDDQAVDLLVAVIGEREHRPVLAGFAGAHLDPAHDAVGAGRGGDLDAVAFGVLQLDGVGQIDGRGIAAHADGVDRVRGQRAGEGSKRERERDEESVGADASGAQKSQDSTSEVGSRRGTRHDVHMSPERIATRLCAEFAAAGLPPTQNACAMLALVALAGFQGKNFAVYFQRVRAVLRRQKVARRAKICRPSACDKCARRQ